MTNGNGTVKIISIVGGILAAAALLLGAGMWLGQTRTSQGYFDQRFKELREDISGLREEVKALDRRLSRIEGKQ